MLQADEEVLVPPLIPLHPQVADPPQDPAEFDTEVPAAHANFTELLHAPLIICTQVFQEIVYQLLQLPTVQVPQAEPFQI